MSASANSNRASSPVTNKSLSAGGQSRSRLDAPKDERRKRVQKTAQPGVDEATILSWLDGDTVADVVPSAKTASSVAIPKEINKSKLPAIELTDDQLLMRIADHLAEKGIPSFTRIGLDVKRGVITVRGSVASKGERLLLHHILRAIPGVLQVNDGMTLGKPAAGKTPSASGKSASSGGAAISGGTASISSRFSDTFASISVAVREPLRRLKSVWVASSAVGLSLGLILVIAVCWPRTKVNPVAVFPVKGKIVMDGNALPNATVLFHPVGDSKLTGRARPHATAKNDGGFVVETFKSGDGAPEGEFVATVHFLSEGNGDGDPTPNAQPLPDIYGRLETSPLRVKFSRETNELAVLELHKSRVR